MQRAPRQDRPTHASTAGSGPPARPPDEPGRARIRPVDSSTDPPSSAVRPASRNSHSRAPSAAAHRSTAGPRDGGFGASPRPPRPSPRTPARAADPARRGLPGWRSRPTGRGCAPPRGERRDPASSPAETTGTTPRHRRRHGRSALRRRPGAAFRATPGPREDPKRLRSGDGAIISGTISGTPRPTPRPLPGPPAGCPCCSAPPWPRRYRSYGAAFLVTGAFVRDAPFPGGCSEGDAGVVVGAAVGSGSWVGEAEGE